MGQMAVGIFYGCEAPPSFVGDENEGLAGLMIARFNERRKGLRVMMEGEGGRTLIGVWVAVSGNGEDGAAYFSEKSFPLSDTVNVYANNIDKAWRLWDRFARHIEEKAGIVLPQPTLWITPCETAQQEAAVSIEDTIKREAKLHQRAVKCVADYLTVFRVQLPQLNFQAHARAIIAQLASLEPPILLANLDHLK